MEKTFFRVYHKEEIVLSGYYLGFSLQDAKIYALHCANLLTKIPSENLKVFIAVALRNGEAID